MKANFKVSRILKKDSERMAALVHLFNEVFEEPDKVASERQLKKLLGKSDFHAIVAIIEGELVGGLTAYEFEAYYSDSSELYIYDIAVKREFQKQGIGKKLINYLKDYAQKNKIEAIFVDAHSEDKVAVKFYASTFGKSEKVDHFNFELETNAKIIKSKTGLAT